MQPDPFTQLDEWAIKAERRVRRAHRLDRLRRLLRPRPRRLHRRGLLLLVAVVAAGAVLWTARSHWPPSDAAAAPYPTMTQPSGVAATTTATARPTGPFEGTPAARYAQGAAGFAMPAAKRHGKWTARQVADALRRVRAALVALYIDRRALVAHDPSTLLPLLAPAVRDDMREQYANPATAPLALLISGSAPLSSEPPRVNGRTTVRTVTDPDGLAKLEIITNYVVAYAYDVPDHGPGSRVVVVHRQVTWRLYRSDQVRPADRGLWPCADGGYHHGIDCVEARKGLLAPWRPNAAPWSPSPDRTPENPDGYYDPNRSLEIEDTCDGTKRATASAQP